MNGLGIAGSYLVAPFTFHFHFSLLAIEAYREEYRAHYSDYTARN